MPGRAFLVAAILLCSVSLWAQYASVFADIADAASLTHEQASWLVLSVAGTLPPGATIADASPHVPGRFPRAGGSGGQPVSAGTLALMLVSIEETSPGFWYAIAPGRLTAFSLVRSRGLIPPDWRPGTVPTGAEAVDAIRAYFEFARARSQGLAR
ncbi:MAG: hypothetical protein EA382_04915 [Spirochaetaceae bacterium]|nr:MAG: hypothetical protein EA382_04915 [Spirochaetaceae bacterium]